MSDPFDNLRPPSRPLPQGGEERTLARGRRALRRQRAIYGGAGTAAVAAGLAVVAIVHPPSSHDSLHSLNASDSPSPTETPSPATSDITGVVPSPLPTPLDSVPALPLTPSPGGPQPTQSPTASPSAEPTEHGPFVGAEPAAADGGPQVTRTMSNDPSFCLNNGQVGSHRHPDGWCSTVTTSGPDDIVAGQRVTYTLTLCRAPETGAATVHFDTRREIGFSAQQEGDSGTTSRWEWGASYDFAPDAHTLTFAAGDCAAWAVTWSGEADDGYAAPEGDYEMIGILAATEYTSDTADYAPPMGLHTGMHLSWH